MQDKIVIVEDGRLAQRMEAELSGVLRDTQIKHPIVHVSNRKDALCAVPPGQLGLVSIESSIPHEAGKVWEPEVGFLLLEDLRRQGYAGYVVLYTGHPDALNRGRQTQIAGKPIVVVDKSRANAAQWAQCCRALLATS